MENLFLSAIVAEMSRALEGRSFGKFSLLSSALVIDLRLADGRVVLASLDPSSPALYLSSEAAAERDADSSPGNAFLAFLRKNAAGAKLLAISKEPADRVVQFRFERFDVGGNKQRGALILALTGRTSNAYLADHAGMIQMMLYERGPLGVGDTFPAGQTSQADLDRARMIAETPRSATAEEIVARHFGPASIFGPQLQKEFLVRSRRALPAEAFRSLLADLFEAAPLPLIYSREPLEQAGSRPLNIKDDLLLSHIELAQAQGMHRYRFGSLSEAAEQFYLARQRAKAFQAEFNSLSKQIADQMKKLSSVLKAIDKDRARFENPERLKQCGDLILANLATARVEGSSVRLTDYYQPSQPEVEIEIGDAASLQQAAARYFERYQRARRAQEATQARRESAATMLESLKKLHARLLEEATSDAMESVRSALDRLLGRSGRGAAGAKPSTKAKAGKGKQAGRRFLSASGYEMVVGRNDKENDAITFRVARPNDIWLHAADYPGSHVVIRNHNRQEVPHHVVVEGAELAAFYSQAKRESKVAVHYTQKKFVTKPPRAKPGLVRLSSFKTLMVEPRCRVERID